MLATMFASLHLVDSEGALIRGPDWPLAAGGMIGFCPDLVIMHHVVGACLHTLRQHYKNERESR